MKQNYRFIAAGLGDQIKMHVYNLRPEPDNKPDKGRSDGFTTNQMRMPMALPDDVYGKFVWIPVIFKTKDNKKLEVPEAIVNINRVKRIVKTAVVGGNGTVKEYIGDDDMTIAITLAIVAVDNEGNIIDEYPAQGVKDLCAILDRPEAVDVVSDFLSVFGVDGGAMKIVVESYQLEQATHSNRQTVTVNAVSDYDYTIYYEE